MSKLRHRTKDKAVKVKQVLYHWTDLILDLLASLVFLTGGILSLSDSFERYGTWMFIIGSVLFGAKPVVKIIRTVTTPYPENSQETN